MKNIIDNITGSAVPFAQVAFNPRVLERNRTELRHFCAHSLKGAVGCGGNTTPACREYPRRSLARLKAPGTLQVAKLQKLEVNMRKANVVDVVDCCVDVLEFLSEVAAPCPAPQTLQLSYKAQSGLSQILVCISERLSAANAAIQSKQTEMEVY